MVCQWKRNLMNCYEKLADSEWDGLEDRIENRDINRGHLKGERQEDSPQKGFV